jgi:hypothetical protein
MSVQFSKAAVIQKNSTAIDACNQSVTRLNNIVGLPPAREAARIAQLSRAVNERTILKQVNAHLRTAGTTVKPMDDAVAADLNNLANKLDGQIQNNLITDATVAFIMGVLNDVSRLGSITASHRG